MKLIIIDGNSIINRTFYGIRMLNAPDGTPTNGVYGFLTILNKLLADERPDGLCVAFDLHAPTFRHKEFSDYKAQRKPMPEELVVQMPLLKEVLDAAGISRFELEDYEADDLIGTISCSCERNGTECVIVTGDKDSFQLITEKTRVKHVKSRMGKTEIIDYTPKVFEEEYGFPPKGIIDLKALMGDASDNIPGVKGIGEKTAMSLIQTYGSIDKIYEDVMALEIKDGIKKKLIDGKADAQQSYRLATIVTDAPIVFSPENCVFSGNFNGAYSIFKRLGFNRLIDSWGLTEANGALAAPPAPSLPAVELSADNLDQLKNAIEKAEHISIVPIDGSLDTLEICDGNTVYTLLWASIGDNYNELLKFLFSEKVRKLSHNVKDLMGLLLAENLLTDGFVFDTALASYLLEPTESSYELKRISAKYLGRECFGAEAVIALYAPLISKLEEENLLELLNTVELPLCPVLADMERVGFAVDRQALHNFGVTLSKRIEELQGQIYDLVGEEFNINSPKQLGYILFEKLMLPTGKKTKTGWSTNADVLEKLIDKHPIIELILEYRQFSKLKSTYCDGLMKVITADGKIHTSFQMTVTATGRLSSVEPNLQNIPVRSELGAEFRKMFVASRGSVLVDADYSQIELRILAHISGDETMKNAFVSGEDIHAVTASQVFGMPLSEVTALQRSHAKAVNFGIVYGISAFSLAQDINVSQQESKAYIEAYLEKYHGVRNYMKTVVEKAKSDGYVATLFGRRRPMPELQSSNFNLRSFGERVALNMPIQGTAADIIKLAMIHVYNRMKAEKLSARLILQVHDELIVECPENEAEKVKALLVEEMERVVSYSVPLTADAGIGKSWHEAK